MLTEEQKEIRRTGIGGSDAAAVAGLSRYKTNVDVYLEKLGYKGFEQESEAAYWGDILEQVVANEFSYRTGEKLTKQENLIKSSKYPWMIANVDRIFSDKNAILECKTASIYRAHEWGEQNTDEIPDEYLLQCAHYRIVTDCDFVAIAVLIGGQEYRQYKYEKNSNLENKLISIEHHFWHEHVLKEEAPEIKNYEDACKLFNKPYESSKHINKEIEAYIKDFVLAKSKIKELENELEKYKAKICAYLENDSLLINELRIPVATWKGKKISRFDTNLFKKMHPKLYSQFIKTTETRDFRLKEVIDE